MKEKNIVEKIPAYDTSTGFNIPDELVNKTNSKEDKHQHDTVSMDEFTLCSKYAVFANLLDFKAYKVYILVKRVVHTNTSCSLLVYYHVIDEDKKEKLIGNCVEMIYNEEGTFPVSINHYNYCVLELRDIVKNNLTKHLNEIVQDKYTTDIKVDIKNTNLSVDLNDFFDSLLILKNPPKVTCTF